MGGSGEMPIREAGPDAPGRWINSGFDEGQRAPPPPPPQQLMLPEVRAGPQDARPLQTPPLTPASFRARADAVTPGFSSSCAAGSDSGDAWGARRGRAGRGPAGGGRTAVVGGGRAAGAAAGAEARGHAEGGGGRDRKSIV